MSARSPVLEPEASATFVHRPPTRGKAVVLAVLGVLVGTWSTLCGVGGGIFAVPILHYGFGMPLVVAVGNSLVLVAAMTTSATASEVLRREESLHWELVLVLVAGSLVGAQLGFRAARRIDARTLKRVFAVVLTLVAVQIAFDIGSPAAGADSTGPFVLRASSYATVGAIGVASGFFAPMLGIGGGLVAVPALFLGFPTLGYLGARSASMVMSMVNGWQSVWLYRRDRHVHVPTAAWFAGGAVIGGWLGVALVHAPGVAPIAQRLLALTMLLAACRFAWDVWSARSVAGVKRK